MNTGLSIRLHKFKKKKKKRETVKDSQVGLCRFILFKNTRIEKVNGCFTYLGTVKIEGLQIENKLYYDDENGKPRYVYINKHGAKVLQRFNGVPDWASDRLRKKYENYMKALADNENLKAVEEKEKLD